MTTTLIFSNPGEIDIRGATIAGLSAKESDNPIGFFGTGLKYAIASVLRWGGTVSIYSGLTEYRFYTEDLDFRGQGFKQIVMEYGIGGVARQPLGFTTEYGKTWQLWQVFRELYSNALDEGGEVYLSGQPVEPLAGQTQVIVHCPELLAIFPERHKIILPADTQWSDEVDIPGGRHVQVAVRSSTSLYYRGVRVRDQPAALTWNVLSKQELTEDRTLKSHFHYEVECQRATCQLTDYATVHAILTAACSPVTQTFESSFEFPDYYEVSPTFLEVAERLYLKNFVQYNKLRAILQKHRPALTEPKALTPSKVQAMQLAKAKRLAAVMLPEVDIEAVDISVRDLGIEALGQYRKEIDAIYLSPKLFEQGTKQVLSCLYEELIHREQQLRDLTYSMQTFLFNQIVSLYEEHVFGEPV